MFLPMPAVGEQDDTLERFCAGHEGAVARVREWIGRVVRLPSWGFDEPDDLIQEVQLRLLRIARAGRYRGESTPKTFVMAVAKHACVDAFRRRRLRHRVHGARALDPVLAAETGALGPSPALAAERIEALRYVFQRLPEACRELWRMVYWQGLPAPEVGARLGVSAGTARVRLHRCLQRARALAAELV